MNRLLRRYNVMRMAQQYLPMARKRRRNQMLLSILGLGLFGGATAFGFVRAKNNGGFDQMLQRLRNRMENINMPKMLRTN